MDTGTLGTIVAPISALIGALGGVYVKNLIDKSEKNRDREFNRDEQLKERKRLAGEELFCHLDEMFKFNYSFHNVNKRWLERKFDGASAIELRQKYLDSMNVDTSKLKYIFYSYYSELISEYEEVMRLIRNLTTLSEDFNIAGSDRISNRPSEEVISNFSSALEEFHSRMNSLSNKIAKASVT